MTQFEKTMAQHNISCHRLETSHAFHSSLMDSTLESFVERMSQIELRPPQIPYVSNLTGRWITAAEATDPRYWAKHLRNTVQFAEGVGELLCQPGRVMIEVGPGQTLASLVRRQIGKGFGGNTAKVFSTLPGREQQPVRTRHISWRRWANSGSADSRSTGMPCTATKPYREFRCRHIRLSDSGSGSTPTDPHRYRTGNRVLYRRRSHTPWLMKPREICR